MKFKLSLVNPLPISFQQLNHHIKTFVMDKFHKRTWDKERGRKKQYCIEEFNPTHIINKKHTQGPIFLGEPKFLLLSYRLILINSVVKRVSVVKQGAGKG